MIRLFVLDVEEFRPVVEVARTSGLAVKSVGAHSEVSNDGPIVIDRRATGVRHGVWYSCVSAIAGGVVVQFDKDALRIEPA